VRDKALDGESLVETNYCSEWKNRTGSKGAHSLIQKTEKKKYRWLFDRILGLTTTIEESRVNVRKGRKISYTGISLGVLSIGKRNSSR